MNIPVSPALVNNNSSAIEVCPPFDRDTIETHLGYLHHAADRAKVPGKLVLAVYGEDPDTRERFAAVEHFAIGDVEGMTNAAMKYDGVPHRNVYAPFAIMSPDLEPGLKGSETDVHAVLAMVIDGDADKGKERPTAPLPPDYIIESSAGNFQEVLFLLQPLKPDEAKPLARALQRATKAEFADDLCHVWRVPGCLNWPNAAKVHDPKRNRSRTPQLVTVTKPWQTWTTVDALRKAVAEHWEQPRAEATPLAPRGTYDNCPIKLRAFHERLRDAGYYDRDADDLETTRLRWLHAAKALSYDLGDAGRPIWEEVVCWKGTRADEGTAVDTGEADYRWHDCSRLREGMKPVTHGSLIKEAQKVYDWKGLHLERDKPASEMFKDKPPLQPGQVGYTPMPPDRAQDQAVAAAPRGPKTADEQDPDKDYPFIEPVFWEQNGDDWTPPDYIFDGIFQRGYVYTITGQTDAGKTNVGLRFAYHVGTGEKLGNIEVEQGVVLYFAGENPEDTKGRWFALCREMDKDHKKVPVIFVYGVTHISKTIARYKRLFEARKIKLTMVLVDTAVAFFEGDKEDDNKQAGDHGRMLRSLRQLPGDPCVLVLAHPTKAATTLEEMKPRGGGALLNEVDGNLGMVRDEAGNIIAAKVGKFRGNTFDPLRFALKVITDHPMLVDVKGRQQTTVIAVPISAGEAVRHEEKADKDGDKVLEALCNSTGMINAEIVRKLGAGWYDKRVERALKPLKAEKLATVTRKRWSATPKGQTYLNAVATAQPVVEAPPLAPANLGPAGIPLPRMVAPPPMPPK
jgi:hypothetical protein